MNTWGYTFISGLIDGVTIGSIYALMALGMALVFGVTRTFNFAHGSFFTWGAYITWYLPVLFKRDLSYPLKFAILIPTMLVFGWIFEKIVIRPVRKASNWLLVVIITTLAAALILDTLALVIFGPLHKAIPPLFEGSISIGSFVIGANDLGILVITTIIIVSLAFFINKTREGTAMRAVAQDLTGANMVGVYVDRTFAYSFAISAVLAGIAGVFIAPKYFISPMGGWHPFIKTFVIVFLGGLGSLKGTVCAAIILGIVEAMVGLYISSTWVMPVWCLVLLAILMLRPRGLFGVWESLE